MTQAAQTPVAKSAERRKEKRYEVQLDGQLGIDGKVVPVRIGDISAAGALLMMAAPPPPEGTLTDLWLDGFGDLEIEVVYSGDGICGVMFTHPAECRDKLLNWLTEDVASKTGAGQ